MKFYHPDFPSFDKSKNWESIEKRVKHRFYRNASILSVCILMVVFGAFYLIEPDINKKLYTQTAFEKILTMESELDQELKHLEETIQGDESNPRFIALTEQIRNINIRLEECRQHILMNPRNPNFHRVYLSLLKSKRHALEILEEMKGES